MSAAASPNFGERRGGQQPSLIVLHYTGMPSCAEARARLCDPKAEVSAHWLIGETGHTEALVPEHLRAWHAGTGSWGGLADVNSRSIGIELANSGSQPFGEPQMSALESLLVGVMARWSIPPHGVIAHSDMAPDRKSDPGRRFDWHRLARSGLSIWPERRHALLADFGPAAQRFGYPNATHVLTAFRLRFRPWGVGAPDAEDAGLAVDLAQRYPAGPA